MTSNVTVLAFDDIGAAEAMLDNLRAWEEAGWIKVEDAVVVTRGASASTVEIKQTHKKGGRYALGGGGVGLLAGLLLGGPIGGLAVGAALGGVVGSMKDYGIDDKFIKNMSDNMKPNSSALFVMHSSGDQEKLLQELQPHKATVVSTTLTGDQEQKLRDSLRDAG